MEPRYEHDCDPELGCIFVGYVDDDDVWFHDHGHDTEVILRHSSDGPDYGCWTSSMTYPHIPEHYQRAIALVVEHKAKV